MPHTKQRDPITRSDSRLVAVPHLKHFYPRHIGGASGLHRMAKAIILLALLCFVPTVHSKPLENHSNDMQQPQAQVQKAQNQQNFGLFSLPLEEMMQIKVTGSTLTEETLRKVPSSVTVFTRKEISKLGIDTLEELMNFVPGFQSYRQGEHATHHGYSSRGRDWNFRP